MEDSARIRRLKRNLVLLCVFRGIQMSLFPVAIIALFVTDTLSLSMFELFILQGAFGVFTAVLEFPGGYLADRIGYRRSMFLASLAAIVGWSAYSASTGFYSVLGCEFLLAISLSLTSGTDSALMYETLLELDEEPLFGQWYGRARSMGAFAEGSAALVAGVLFATWSRLPFVVETVVWVVNAAIALLLIEPRREQAEPKHPWLQTKALLHYTFIKVPKLRALTATTVLIGMSTFIPVWIIAVYARDAGVSDQWIGPMWAGANYCVALGHLSSTRIAGRLGVMPTLVLCVMVIGIGYGGLGLSYFLFGFLFYYVLCYARGINGPILSHEQQRLIPSSDRAALLSVTSLVFRSLFAILSPILGNALNVYGNHDVLKTIGAIFVPLALLCLSWFRSIPTPELVQSRGEIETFD